MTTHCDLCGFEHPPDSGSAFVDFSGRCYRAPFRCLCCGVTICVQQFASRRACGWCDTGKCQNGVLGSWKLGHGHVAENRLRFAEQGERP